MVTYKENLPIITRLLNFKAKDSINDYYIFANSKITYKLNLSNSKIFIWNESRN